MTLVKICGLFREADIDYVNEARPDYVGFILRYPQSRRNVSPERARQLKSRLIPAIRAVGVFVDQPLETVAAAAEQAGLDVIQLHGREDNAYIAALRHITDRPIWKAFRVQTQADLVRAGQSGADEVLLDNGCGTGQAFDWTLTAGFARPFMLAGGLTPENVAEAVRRVRPKLVDISSGAETDGVKDREKIIAAVRAARQA